MKAGGNAALALPEARLGESVNGEFKAVYDMPEASAGSGAGGFVIKSRPFKNFYIVPGEITMSRKHPVIAVTGSSGAGTSTVKRAFENIFRREKIAPAIVEGDSLHSLDRMAFRAAVAEAAKAGDYSFSHFGPEANHFDKIEETFKQYGESGMCRRRYYVHSEDEAVLHNKHFNLADLKPGQFTPWEDIEANSDMLFHEGLHGLAAHGDRKS